jgi:hypothetical protein
MNENDIHGDVEKAPESLTGSEAVHEATPVVKSVEDGGTSMPVLTPASGPLPPPNGGTLAWLQVLGSFCLWFATLYVKHLDRATRSMY